VIANGYVAGYVDAIHERSATRQHSSAWAYRRRGRVVSLPVHLGVALVTAYLWTVAAANIAYPLRPDTADLANAWGGPTLAGAWAVHGTAGVLFLFATPWIVRGLTGLQVRLAGRTL
jgi:hypothetical protein